MNVTDPMNISFLLRLFDSRHINVYLFHLAKFRILTAFHNPGKRPAYKISCLTFNTRYYHRGIDHPYGNCSIF